MTHPPDSDLGLLKRLQSGDRTAVAELYDLHFDHLYSLIFNLVGEDQLAAEDIVEETLMVAIKSAKRFRRRSSIYIWLCSIAYSRLAEHYRQQSREHKPDIHAIEVAIDHGRWSENGRPIGSLETRRRLIIALEKLSLDYRQALLLKYVEDMSLGQIAEIMHRSPKATEDLLTRARETLQTHLWRSERDDPACYDQSNVGR